MERGKNNLATSDVKSILKIQEWLRSGGSCGPSYDSLRDLK